MAKPQKEKERIINLNEVVGKGYASFWHDRHRYLVVKGGRSSKKSRTTGLRLIHNTMKYPLSNTVVIRKTGNTHKDSTFAVLKWAAERLGVAHLWQFKENPMEAIYTPTGQVILFRAFDDVLKLTSITVAVGVLCWVWWEEVYEIDDEDDFNTFDEAIRGEMPEGLWKQHILTFNPWVNSHWTKKRFFDNTDPDAFTLTTTYKCNEWLDDADRRLIENLEISNPDRYRVVGLGEYGIPGGAYFDEFRTDVHVMKPFVIPEDWRRYRVFDYGLDMLACYWVAVDSQGKAYVYKELYEKNLIISDASKRIKQMTGKDKIYETIAPPDMRHRVSETGKSKQELFSDNGIWLTIANNERVTGWLNLKEWLKPYEAIDEEGNKIISADLKIFSTCVNLIDSLQSIASDEKDPSDCATQPHDVTHACLTGDTIVNTVDGDFKIEDLLTKSGYVYCYDERLKQKTTSKYFNVTKTSKNAEIIRITLEDGTLIKCTKDHPILTENGWKRADELLLEDDIVNI